MAGMDQVFAYSYAVKPLLTSGDVGLDKDFSTFAVTF